MSRSLSPWMLDYLVNIAETYGANIQDTKRFPTNKKAQIIEVCVEKQTRFLVVEEKNQFLTYSRDTYVWAFISDKSFRIPVKFSADSVREYERKNPKKHITSTKTCLIALKKFKPFLSRVPVVAKNGQRMTPFPEIALDCDAFDVMGSIGEETWGDPKPLESNADLKAWRDGLRQDGGAGHIFLYMHRNVLKERKALKQAQLTATVEPVQAVKARSPKSSPGEGRPKQRINDLNSRFHCPKPKGIDVEASGAIGNGKIISLKFWEQALAEQGNFIQPACVLYWLNESDRENSPIRKNSDIFPVEDKSDLSPEKEDHVFKQRLGSAPPTITGQSQPATLPCAQPPRPSPHSPYLQKLNQEVTPDIKFSSFVRAMPSTTRSGRPLLPVEGTSWHHFPSQSSTSGSSQPPFPTFGQSSGGVASLAPYKPRVRKVSPPRISRARVGTRLTDGTNILVPDSDTSRVTNSQSQSQPMSQQHVLHLQSQEGSQPQLYESKPESRLRESPPPPLDKLPNASNIFLVGQDARSENPAASAGPQGNAGHIFSTKNGDEEDDDTGSLFSDDEFEAEFAGLAQRRRLACEDKGTGKDDDEINSDSKTESDAALSEDDAQVHVRMVSHRSTITPHNPEAWKRPSFHALLSAKDKTESNNTVDGAEHDRDNAGATITGHKRQRQDTGGENHDQKRQRLSDEGGPVRSKPSSQDRTRRQETSQSATTSTKLRALAVDLDHILIDSEGYEVRPSDVEHTNVSTSQDGSPAVVPRRRRWMTWPRLQDILLRMGKHRARELAG
ncbi:hypothetical protein FISHEDRAFT_61907 [Fistulina hepatica ATCC 64428]|uniref:Shelterin complex subunit TPP1/Est3 domain-containing protein n=1 Tax=Fistulina hepatica ATCC 64428 TaxID=1128425 RepID=A0A0D7A021_9AGAR|nr:hypothetical protein FISHEDRAFT_61907 [Fistulina hepatica ATCC 64428]